MKNFDRKIKLPLFVLLAGLFAVQATGFFDKPQPDERQFAQRANLAIRQTADRLLDLAGDSTRTIPPVEQVSAKEYLLRLENNFNYDSLPVFLAAALSQFDIDEKYYVSVIDCLDNILMLGYSQETLNDGEPPCGGREQKAGCYNLTVTFPGREKKEAGYGWIWAGLALLTGLAFALPFFDKKLKTKALEETPAFADTPAASHLRFGNCRFDPAGQYVQIGDLHQPLTFREAKLLLFFVQNLNKVLEREAILAAVWEDEGVIVSRSLDVFVSRLRKILQPDPSVKISSVHGVGYRLEVGA